MSQENKNNNPTEENQTTQPETQPETQDEIPKVYSPHSPEDTPPNARDKKLYSPHSPDEPPPDLPETKKNGPSKKYRNHVNDLFTPVQATTYLHVPFHKASKSIKKNLQNMLVAQYENYCNVYGFIKEGSIQLLQHSAGVLHGSDLEFVVSYQCLACLPAEGVTLDCVVKNVTKAGLRCEIANMSPPPLVIFVARDHHNTNEKYHEVEENDAIIVRIIGKRFELHDRYVSAIAEFMEKI